VRELLVYLAQQLVDEPGQVEVEQFEEDDGTLVHRRVLVDIVE